MILRHRKHQPGKVAKDRHATSSSICTRVLLCYMLEGLQEDSNGRCVFFDQSGPTILNIPYSVLHLFPLISTAAFSGAQLLAIVKARYSTWTLSIAAIHHNPTQIP